MRLSPYEIVLGIVAYLEPPLLLAHDVVGPPDVDLATIERHPFACLDSSNNMSVWTLLTTKPGDGRRIEVPAEGRRGHSGWLKRRNYVNSARWVIHGPNYAIVEASGWEFSRPGARNYISDEFTATLRSYCDMPKPSTIRLLRAELQKRGLLGPPSIE